MICEKYDLIRKIATRYDLSGVKQQLRRGDRQLIAEFIYTCNEIGNKRALTAAEVKRARNSY